MTESEFQAELLGMRSKLIRFASLQLRDPHLAEDVVQETFVAAIAGRERFAGESQLKTWVVAILRNKIVDAIRLRSREVQLPASDGNETEDFDSLFSADGHWAEQPADWGNPEHTLQQRQFFEVLELCMTALPEKLSRVFLMREVLELETEEICKELAMSSSNCWVVLHRARMRLRECLQIKWFSEAEGHK